MKQRRYFAWVLMVVSMVMLAATILPHHHHHSLLCFTHHEEIETVSCESGCEHSEPIEDETTPCQEGCVTVFHSLTPADMHHHHLLQYSTCVLLFSLLPVLTSILFFFDSLKTYSYKFLEKLHAVKVLCVRGLRAPPYLFA